jgi:hypothetical protein
MIISFLRENDADIRGDLPAGIRLKLLGTHVFGGATWGFCASVSRDYLASAAHQRLFSYFIIYVCNDP